MLTLFDTGGNEIWTNAYGTSNFEEGYGAIYDNGIIYVYGKTRGNYSGSLSSILLSIDLGGEIIWSYTYGKDDLIEERSMLQIDKRLLMVSTDNVNKIKLM